MRTGDLSASLVGISAVRDAAAPFSPERVAAVAGIDAATIRRLTRDFVKAERAACYGRVGLCTQEFGGLGAWLVVVLHALTARLDAAGGAMFTKPALDLVGMGLVPRGHFARWRSRVRGLPELGGELPVAALAEEIDTPGKGSSARSSRARATPCSRRRTAGASTARSRASSSWPRSTST